MKTKEEILHKHVDKEVMDSLSSNVWSDILDAMEESTNQYLESQARDYEQKMRDASQHMMEQYAELTYHMRAAFGFPKSEKPKNLNP